MVKAGPSLRWWLTELTCWPWGPTLATAPGALSGSVPRELVTTSSCDVLVTHHKRNSDRPLLRAAYSVS
jgi:hypothetical protein